jgi:cyclopropane fatty-acyl-phospholipid synthase-like methyltransferase
MLRRLLAFALLALTCAQAQTPHTHEHRFSGAERWARVFDDPARDRWQKPDEVIAALALAPDAAVADVGAGTGYFAVRLARAVPKGRVYAVDIEPDMVRYLGERAKREGLPNLRPVLGKPDDPQLPEPVDRVLIVDTYHHIGDRIAYFERLRARLKPGGQVAIVDFTLESPVGPPRSARIPAQQVREEMQRAGYALATQHDFLPHQYFLVFRPR